MADSRALRLALAIEHEGNGLIAREWPSLTAAPHGKTRRQRRHPPVTENHAGRSWVKEGEIGEIRLVADGNGYRIFVTVADGLWKSGVLVDA